MLITKAQYIQKLGQQVSLYEEDIQSINEDWDDALLLAEQVLPQIPPVGLLSTAKAKEKIYRQIKSQLRKQATNAGLTHETRNMAELILEYSNKDFARAVDGQIDARAERSVYPRGRIRHYFPHAVFWLGLASWSWLSETITTGEAILALVLLVVVYSL